MVNIQENLGVRIETIEAFHMMWDNFPHPVLLLKKSREIVAMNKCAQERGYLACGKCFERGGKTEIHAGCLANTALELGEPQRKVSYNKATNRITDGYWLPVPDEKDLYLHFAVYIDLPAENQPG